MRQKNYYAILGVTRKSSKEDLKKAYRTLAKKYHPDSNKEQNSETIFKDVTEAYNTLSCEEKRRRYDRSVLRYKYGFDNSDKSLPNVKYEIKSGMNVINDIVSTIFGLKKDDDAKNFGDIDNEPDTKIKKDAEKGKDIETNLEITLDEGFFGAEKKIAIKGYKGGMKTFTVQVPIGIKNGDKIRLAALGMPGKNGGKNGDLIIHVKLKDDEDLKLKGLDLKKTIIVSPALAVVGGTYKLETIDKTISVPLHKGLKNGEIITVKENGYVGENNKRGDLILTVCIEIPENISEREEKVYAQLLRIEQKTNRE